MKHSMHFTNNEEMDYCASTLDTFLKNFSHLQTNEFDGDNENEVTFTTSKLIPKSTLTKIIKHFDPKGHTFNQQ